MKKQIKQVSVANKRFIKFIALMLVLLTPAILLLSTSAVTGDVFQQTYYAALEKQFDRLCQTNEEKVVFVGGSNIAFGMDSRLFEQLYGQPAVSFGLYGSLGIKSMMDLSKANLKRGDTVVLIPELDPEAYSTYFGGESVWKAVDGRLDMLLSLGFDNAEKMIGTYFDFISTKYDYYLDNTVLAPTGVYCFDGVDQYGEIQKGLRTSNVMSLGYLAQTNLSSFAQIKSDFIDYINDYVDYCNNRGVEVYFSFSPFNQMAMEKSGITQQDLMQLCADLIEALDCIVISNPMDYVYDYRYFYDTNFHLNDAGVPMRTAQLVRDLQFAKGNMPTIKVSDYTIDPPERQQFGILEWIELQGIDVNLETTPWDCFEMEYDETTGYYTIVGVVESARHLEEIIVPVIDLEEEKIATRIKEGAFSNCPNLKVLTIPAGITTLDAGCFASNTLTAVRLLPPTGDNIMVTYQLMNDSHADCKLYLVNAKIHDYTSSNGGYGWGDLASYMVEGDVND
ncbi:MAG: hypothetical protein IJF72_04690 [Clostridia bacterium]|nr:hypothetical protein [Clostridia bacterium]